LIIIRSSLFINDFLVRIFLAGRNISWHLRCVTPFNVRFFVELNVFTFLTYIRICDQLSIFSIKNLAHLFNLINTAKSFAMQITCIIKCDKIITFNRLYSILLQSNFYSTTAYEKRSFFYYSDNCALFMFFAEQSAFSRNTNKVRNISCAGREKR